ncbi:unnamed protein product [Prunus brigantina]
MFEMGVKLDMNKVHDREVWDFLEAVMIRMRFTDRWMELIMRCITTAKTLKGVYFPNEIFVQARKGGFEGGRLQLVANGMVDLEQRVNSIINFDTRNWNLNLI